MLDAFPERGSAMARIPDDEIRRIKAEVPIRH